MKTATDFTNAGYSPSDAARLASDPATNWQAANGGNRAPLNIAAPTNQHTNEMTKHTPGPWTLCPITNKNGEETRAVISENGTLITYDLPRVAAHPELMANALLMAAAPELLVALRGLVSDMERIMGRQMPADHEARAAIAKATPAPAKQAFPLTLRRTHKYASGWSSLDEWEEIGTYTIEASKPPRWFPGGEQYRQLLVVRVEVSEFAEFPAIRDALSDSMSGSSCRHEHDCCGCISRDVFTVRQLRNGMFAVLVCGSRNL